MAPFINSPRSPLGAVDIKEIDNAYEFYVDVPGLTKEEVKVDAQLHLIKHVTLVGITFKLA